MTQNEMIIDYLKQNDFITPLEAVSELGIMRLASRICDLRKAGYDIEKELIQVKNRYGKTCRVMKYRLRN